MPDMFYLASQSPRRRQLLESVGLQFAILAPDVDERVLDHETPEEVVQRLALEKAAAGAAMLRREARPARPVVAADTVVVIDDQVLGKPADAGQAYAMLAQLSGRTHRVLTAVALQDGEERVHRLSDTRVTMKSLARWEMECYWATGEPADKAGAYAVQGIGSGFVARLEGSYSGVVGLPLYETRELLASAGIHWL